MMRNAIAILSLCLMCILPAAASAEEDLRWEMGVRSGCSFISADKIFVEADLFLQRDLPLTWTVMKGLAFGTRAGGAVGLLAGRTVTGFLGHAGPELFLNMAEVVQLHGGVHVGVLSERSYIKRDFGGRFQFVNHGGLRMRLGQHYLVGYRYQHMSNADIYKENPGLNIHFIEMAYRF